jgi:hypothetical protein
MITGRMLDAEGFQGMTYEEVLEWNKEVLQPQIEAYQRYRRLEDDKRKRE